MTSHDLSAAERQDAATRQRIVSELNKNFVVEAAAGTGKTTSLVNRMVASIESNVCRIDQLVAVTFTRKAAAELRERFQAELRQRASTSHAGETDPAVRARLSHAADSANQAFVGTIHSFCAALLRERPIEFRVDPAFRELDETEDALLREQAWRENINDLIAGNDPLIARLQELNLDRQQLKSCFDRFIEFRDIDDWPVTIPAAVDVDELKRQTREYIEEMRRLIPTFPVERGNDELMDRYEEIVRGSARAGKSTANFFTLLERFNSDKKPVQKIWATAVGGSKQLGKQQQDRWREFRAVVAKPGLDYWSRLRYRFVVDFLRRAVAVYERLKRVDGGLDFQDLLITVARGLRSQAELRTYFRRRYTHLLVDEFQDTDPLQAEMMLLLTSTDHSQTDWSQCVPHAGSLFVVGDPKQSIYRFRRGDIITYERVKTIVCDNAGEVLPLVKNFRSRTELREWNNQVFRRRFGSSADRYSPAAEDMVQGRCDAESSARLRKPFVGIYRLDLPTHLRIAAVRVQEADSIAKFIRQAVDSGLEIPRTDREVERGRSPRVEPCDFLIVPWGKKYMTVYTDALERHQIPYQVSGGNPLGTNPYLTVLIDCLRAIDDPHNPVHYLAVLRDFFGFSDRELFGLKAAGGTFNYTGAIPESLDEDLRQRFAAVSDRLKTYRIWIRSQPYATAVAQIAEDLGLFSAAASSAKRNMQAGGLFKIVQWLRHRSWDFDSASDLIDFLDEVQNADDADGCPALPPDGNVVRIMNLHKAKGLEAPIVFLADPSSKYRGEVRCHIDRLAGRPTGYMGITAPKGQFQTKDVATPDNWKALQEEEQRFLDAELDRLLYVAATRAGCATIVSVGGDTANWADLYPHLGSATRVGE